MDWNIEHQRKINADRIKAAPRTATTAYDASLTPAAGVTRTSRGGSSSPEMTGHSRPLEAVFRWDDSVVEPQAVLRWRETANGEIQELTFHLGL